MDKETFICVVKMFLASCNKTKGRDKKTIIAKGLFKFIHKYTDIMNEPSFIKFLPVILDKLDTLTFEDLSFKTIRGELIHKLHQTSNKSYLIYVENVLKK